MPLCLDALPVPRHFALRVDEHGRTDDAEEGLPVEELLSEGVVRCHYLLVRVREEWDGEFVFCLEPAVALCAVARNAVDDRPASLELLMLYRELTPFDGAAGRVVFRVEVEHDPLSFQVFQRDLLPVLIRQGELRRWFLESNCHSITKYATICQHSAARRRGRVRRRLLR